MRSCQIHCHIILFLVLSSPCVWASPQMPDYIIFKGDTIATYNLILESYLQQLDSAKSETLFGLSFRNNMGGGATFNCWRGYQAIYKIDNDSFFLVDIIRCGERRYGKIDKAESIKQLKAIFGDRVVNDRVYITWFTGELSFPLNNNLIRWDGVFYKIYEKETLVRVDNGKVIWAEAINNYVHIPHGIDRRDKKKISDILFKKIKHSKWVDVDSMDCSEKYWVTIGEDGKVSKVIMVDYQLQDTIDRYWDREEYNYCLNTMYKVLRKLQFDIIKDKGKPITEDVYIEIEFDDEKRKIYNWTR